MAVIFDETAKTITLHTKNSTYQMLIGRYNYLLHLYYGKRAQGSMEHLLTYYDHGFSGNPYDAEADRTFSMDSLPQEYPCKGTGDYRTEGLIVQNADGSEGCDLRYHSHSITSGKYALDGLPAVYCEDDHAQTLAVVLKDSNAGVEVTLLYGVLEEQDIITRSVLVKNTGTREVILRKVQSASLDFLYGEYEMLHFYGRHGMERMLEKTPVSHLVQKIGSRRGTSSHQQNPFVILTEAGATEDAGNCYGMSFVYSGNFTSEAEQDQYHQTRWTMGLGEDGFAWKLESGQCFTAPEVIMSFSGEGLTTLSRNYHKVIRDHICRGSFKKSPRPVLINNWEATYFDFTGEKIYQIAKQASELGVELFVLDDGWFGKRDSDYSGLGDWFVNEEKLGEPLSELVERINSLGMKFGIWIEPEMVSEDSELYRTHPDWALQIPGKAPVRGRSQLVLDFSRKEVVDEVFNQITKVLDSANIAYVKMDMNRSICDVYSNAVSKEEQGMVYHKYVLGVYDFLERLNKRYPQMLIEGCSGGGGRFDAGMLYYTPQIWCSDDTDAIERLSIQYGTSYGYPVSAVGAHVSAVPSEQTGRFTNIKTRATVAMSGSFGYELDLNKVTIEEKEAVKQQIADFHKYWEVIHNGDYYRITNPMENREIAAWQFVSEDKSKALMNVVTLASHCNSPVSYVKFKGLDPEKRYQVSDAVFYGSTLMNAGLPVPIMNNEYQSWQVYATEVK